MFDFILSVPRGLMACFFFIFGAIWGSFANVVIYRMICSIKGQENLDLFKKSYCPHCRKNIPFYLNIPLISWFLLGGMCKNCGQPISFRYLLVECLMAGGFFVLFLTLGWKWFLLEALLFAFAVTVAGFIDWDQMILPDSLTLSGIAIGLLGAWLNPERSFLPALWGCLAGGGWLWFISYAYYILRGKEGLGMGDVKMAAWIGAVLGWQSLFFVIIVSCFMGSLVGLGIIVSQGMAHSGKIDFQKLFPFGPYLAFSSLLYIFLNKWLENNVLFWPSFFLF